MPLSDDKICQSFTSKIFLLSDLILSSSNFREYIRTTMSRQSQFGPRAAHSQCRCERCSGNVQHHTSDDGPDYFDQESRPGSDYQHEQLDQASRSFLADRSNDMLERLSRVEEILERMKRRLEDTRRILEGVERSVER